MLEVGEAPAGGMRVTQHDDRPPRTGLNSLLLYGGGAVVVAASLYYGLTAPKAGTLEWYLQHPSDAQEQVEQCAAPRTPRNRPMDDQYASICNAAKEALERLRARPGS